ncbi:beta-class phenol-soluble modulin [Lactiplantibacillus plantarum]|uniref:beta-class phenol-soluble modulin n=1 Tax=Lactiplantibacillus plantarum TaxID=1590 RepID=UPI0021A2EBAE|nr:beta-class phenol-soluble modulin [Lactiplantibacillus plantarum]MCT3214138.1 beta-class phenol-soluble modulin [Lactiplantibacillus plantarum]MCT3271722.1 beta-class phenol-soluble modulin [Lactiplantibacillus plantarum]
MAALFEAIRNVVTTAINSDWVGMGTNIVNIVAAAVNIPISLASTILHILGIV